MLTHFNNFDFHLTHTEYAYEVSMYVPGFKLDNPHTACNANREVVIGVY